MRPALRKRAESSGRRVKLFAGGFAHTLALPMTEPGPSQPATGSPAGLGQPGRLGYAAPERQERLKSVCAFARNRHRPPRSGRPSPTDVRVSFMARGGLRGGHRSFDSTRVDDLPPLQVRPPAKTHSPTPPPARAPRMLCSASRARSAHARCAVGAAGTPCSRHSTYGAAAARRVAFWSVTTCAG